MSADLENGFTDKLEAAILDDVEAKAPGMAQEMQAEAEQNWRRYAGRNGYDIQHIWRESETFVNRTPGGVNFGVEWPFSAQFEFGVDPHPIEATGGDLLAFPWPEMAGVPFGDTDKTFDEVFADTWPMVFFPRVNWGSISGGIPAARAIRNMLRVIRLRWSR